MYSRREMLDLVVIDGKARGIVCRNLVTGEIESYAGDAVLAMYRWIWECILLIY